MNRLKMIPFSYFAEINPPTEWRHIEPNTAVSFIPMSDVTETGQWVGRQTRKLSDVSTGYTVFREDDLLFAKITPCMENGKGGHAINLTNRVGFGSTEFHVIRAKGGTCSRFLFHWLQHEQTRIKALSFMGGSAGQQRVQADFFHHYQIPALEPKQQSRIARILDAADALIAKSEAVISKLRQVRAGLLHDLLTRGLDADGSLRDPAAHPKQFKDSPLGRIPREWEARRIGELIAGFETGVSVDSTDIPVAEGEIGVLKTGCVNGGTFDPTQNKRVKPDHISRVRCKPKADSLIISRMNTPQLVGESAYVATSYSHVFLPDRLWQSVKHPNDPTCIRWLAHSIQTVEFRNLISGGATGTSGSMKNISQSFFLTLRLRTPPKHEQEALSALLATHDRMITAEQAELAKLRQLKSGLMTDLLEGRVRVPDEARHGSPSP